MKTIRKYGRRRTDGVRALVELLKDIIILAAVLFAILSGGDLGALLGAL